MAGHEGRSGIRTLLKDDVPVRTISLGPILMDVAEVTNERYAAFVKATGHRAPYNWRDGQLPEGKEKHPVVNVSWDDATRLLRGRRQAIAYRSRMGARLPRIGRRIRCTPGATATLPRKMRTTMRPALPRSAPKPGVVSGSATSSATYGSGRRIGTIALLRGRARS